jgi:small-conductance mechanosensitive channel
MKKFLKSAKEEAKSYLQILKVFAIFCIWVALIIISMNLICEASTVSVVIGCGGLALAITFAVRMIIKLFKEE